MRCDYYHVNSVHINLQATMHKTDMHNVNCLSYVCTLQLCIIHCNYV